MNYDSDTDKSHTDSDANNNSTPDEAKSKLRIQKDLDWIHNKRRLRLGPVKANILMNQLKSDCVFLAKMDVMDYSLLIGMHFLARGNREHIFERGMNVIEHDPVDHHRYIVKQKLTDNGNDSESSDLAGADRMEVSPLDDMRPLEERQMSVFYGDNGGYRSTFRNDRPADELYFLGIIDILTPYGKRKRLEHMFKSLRYSSDAISTINPVDYARRFLNFCADCILRYPLTREHVDRPLPPEPKTPNA